MLKVSTTVDLSNLSRRLVAMRREVPKAKRDAVNNLAFAAREDVQKEMDARLRAKPWTRRGILVQKATTESDPAVVYVADSQVKYLRENILGGQRPLKTFEKRLSDAGILPSGWFVIPAKALPLDSYGKPRRAALVQILQAVAPNKGPRLTRSGRTAKTQYVAVSHAVGRLKPGIYKKVGNALTPLLLFVPKDPSYSVRLPFHEIAAQSVRANLSTAVRKALDRALR